MLSNRLNNITPSYTIGISSKVRDLKSKGKSIIDLSIGEPDLAVPNAAIQYGINSLNENLTNYDLVPGLKILRDELSKKKVYDGKYYGLFVQTPVIKDRYSLD